MGLFSIPPTLSYNVTRDVKKHAWLGPAAVVLGAIALAVLVVLNIALTAYEVIITKTDDFYATQSHWYDRFRGDETPGTMCSAYNFTTGDTFFTNSSLLEYSLIAAGSKGNQRSIPYSGGVLDSCDILYITFDADGVSRVVTVIAYIACDPTTFPIVAKTTFVGTPLLGQSTRAEALPLQYASENGESYNANNLVQGRIKIGRILPPCQAEWRVE